MLDALRASPEVHAVAHTLTGEGFDASEDGTGRGTPLVPALLHALTAAKSGQRNDPTEATFLPLRSGVRRIMENQ